MTQEPGSLPPRERARGALDAEPRLAWLLRRKVTVPDRVEGHVDRERLVLRAMPTRNRLTVLMAPGGFGKTDYARPAVLERRTSIPAVERFLGRPGASRLRPPAEALLAAMRRADADRGLKVHPPLDDLGQRKAAQRAVALAPFKPVGLHLLPQGKGHR